MNYLPLQMVQAQFCSLPVLFMANFLHARFFVFCPYSCMPLGHAPDRFCVVKLNASMFHIFIPCKGKITQTFSRKATRRQKQTDKAGCDIDVIAAIVIKLLCWVDRVCCVTIFFLGFGRQSPSFASGSIGSAAAQPFPCLGRHPSCIPVQIPGTSWYILVQLVQPVQPIQPCMPLC